MNNSFEQKHSEIHTILFSMGIFDYHLNMITRGVEIIGFHIRYYKKGKIAGSFDLLYDDINKRIRKFKVKKILF